MNTTRLIPALALAIACTTLVAPPAALAAKPAAAAKAETPDQLYERAQKIADGDAPNKEVQAAKLYRQAADRGHGYAKLHLSFLYGNQYGKVYNRAEALKWARKAWAEPAGDVMLANSAADQVSTLLRQEGSAAEVQESLQILETLSKTEPLAFYTLATVWENGVGEILPADQAKATEYYRKSAEADNVFAVASLAERLLEGKGCAANASEAVAWYRKGAEKESPSNVIGLIKVYRTGYPGVDKNPAAAMGWARKLVGMNIDVGYQIMGELYEEGVGVDVDYAQARSWYRKAYEKEFTSPEKLARLHEKGLGGPVDLVTAYAYYRLADYAEGAEANANRLYAGFDKATKKRADAQVDKLRRK